MKKRGTTWHPGTELPPLHKKVWQDDDGIVHKMRMSDWVLVQDDTCDPEYTGPVVVARYEQEGDQGWWMTPSGRAGTVFRWHKIPLIRIAETSA